MFTYCLLIACCSVLLLAGLVVLGLGNTSCFCFVCWCLVLFVILWLLIVGVLYRFCGFVLLDWLVLVLRLCGCCIVWFWLSTLLFWLVFGSFVVWIWVSCLIVFVGWLGLRCGLLV